MTPDSTPPRLRLPNPVAGGIEGSLTTVNIFFNKPINPSTLDTNSFFVVGAGPDGIFGTADDIRIPGVVAYRPGINAGVITFASALPAGLYRATVGAGVADSLGDRLGNPYSWRFWAIGGLDTDRDGVPDDVEIKMGLNPLNADSKGDGIRDGDRDFDNDGLSNAAEIVMGTDPMNPHSKDPNILDGDLDLDLDSLPARLEFKYGTNPLAADSDGDGWNDESEVTGGSDPLDPQSTPRLLLGSLPPVGIGLPHYLSLGGLSGVTMASPPVSIGIPAAVAGESFGIVMSQPPVSIGLPATSPGIGTGVVVSQPPVAIGLPSFGGIGASGVTVGQPPVRVKISGN